MAILSSLSNWSSYVLAMPFDGTDNSTTFTEYKQHTPTANGNVKIKTDQSVFGGASAYFDGSGDFISFADSPDWDLPGDFTIHFRIRPTTINTYHYLIGRWQNANNSSWAIELNSSGYLKLLIGNSYYYTSSSTLSINNWYHIAVTRSSGSLRIFINGTLTGSAATINNNFSTSLPLTIGTEQQSGGTFYAGYMDDLVMVKGVALWTANFTPPASGLKDSLEFTNVQQVDLPYIHRENHQVVQCRLPFRAVTTLKQQIALPYGSLHRPRAQVDLPYTHRPTAKAVVDLGYGSLVPAVTQLDLPYRISAGLVRQQIDLPYKVTDQLSARSQVDLPYWHTDSGATLAVSATMTVGAITIEPAAVELTWSRDQYAISATVTLADLGDYQYCAPGQSITLSVLGMTYTLVIESRTRRRSHGNWAATLTCLSPAAWLDAPYAATLTGEYSGLASAIAANMAGTVAIAWNTIDWTIPPATLIAANQTPLALLRNLAAAAGAVLLSLPDGTLSVEPAYPVPVNQWQTAIPALTIREPLDVLEASEQDDHRPGYNRYLVASQLAAEAGITIEDSAESELVHLLQVYQTPWADDFDCSHTGGNWVHIEDLGVEQSSLSEVIEIVSGEGRTAKPIYAITALEWRHSNLGTVTFSEDGRVVASVDGESLLALTYTTKCHRYRARTVRAEQVQFVVEEAA